MQMRNSSWGRLLSNNNPSSLHVPSHVYPFLLALSIASPPLVVCTGSIPSVYLSIIASLFVTQPLPPRGTDWIPWALRPEKPTGALGREGKPEQTTRWRAVASALLQRNILAAPGWEFSGRVPSLYPGHTPTRIYHESFPPVTAPSPGGCLLAAEWQGCEESAG